MSAHGGPNGRRPGVGTTLRMWRIPTLLATLAVLGGCATGPNAGPNLDGLWTLTWEGTALRPDFGSTGALTLDIDGTSARYLGVDADSGFTACFDVEVAYFAGGLVVFSAPLPFEEEPARWGFLVDRSGGTPRLANDLEAYALRRVVGAPPVAECAPVEAGAPVALPFDLARSQLLHAVGHTLYFNTGDDGETIVGWSLETMSVVSTRTLTDTFGFGNLEPYLAAAQSDDRFFGTCRCGGSTGFTYFDLGTDTALARVETSDLGARMNIRFGYLEPGTGHLVIGGSGYDTGGAATAVNRLLTIDPATLLLVGQRDILADVRVRDVALLGDRLFALANPEQRAPEVVEIGADGRALRTYTLAGAVGGYPVGLTAVGDLLYLLTEDFEQGDVLLYAVAVD